jgi:ABC-type molybdate transport system substrate-binding protein
VFVGGAWATRSRQAPRSNAARAPLVYVSDTTGALQKRLAAGERADLVVVTGPAMDALQQENRVVAGTRVDLARALIGVGVRAGALAPDLSTPDTFKAPSSRRGVCVNPASGGTSGTISGLQRMGIAEAMAKSSTGRGIGRR